MFWLRLLAGLGIGGVIPNVVAINAESAPRKLAPRLRLSLLDVYRSAAPFLASSPRRLYRNMAGKSCF